VHSSRANNFIKTDPYGGRVRPGSVWAPKADFGFEPSFWIDLCIRHLVIGDMTHNL
jgi:hypothetical protein